MTKKVISSLRKSAYLLESDRLDRELVSTYFGSDTVKNKGFFHPSVASIRLTESDLIKYALWHLKKTLIDPYEVAASEAKTKKEIGVSRSGAEVHPTKDQKHDKVVQTHEPKRRMIE